MAFKSLQDRINSYWIWQKQTRFWHPNWNWVLLVLVALWVNNSLHSPHVWIPLTLLLLIVGKIGKKEGHYFGYMDGYETAISDYDDLDFIDPIDKEL